jgi:uncharacterized protein
MRNVLRLCAALALGVSTAPAVDWKALKPQGYVSDFAGVVDEASKAQVENFCAALERATGAQVALVTVRSLEEEPIEDAANTLFRAWGVGQKGKNEGLLLLLAIQEHRSRIETGYGLEPILPDGFVGSVLREMRPALREGRFGEALMAAAQIMGSTVAQAKGVTLDTQLPRRRARPATSDSIPWPFIAGGIALLLFLFSRGGFGPGGFLSGMLLGSMMGRGSWGGSSGGGFGGSDSGDSFGGFGGGDSGGGGASSDW